MNLSFKVSKPNYENDSNENNRLYCFTSVTLTFLNLIWYSFRRYSLEAQMGVIKNFKTKLALYQYLSVYCPNAGKYGAEKLRIRTVFAQDYFVFFFFSFWIFPYTTTRQFNVLRTEFAAYWVLFQQKMGAIFYIAFYIYLTMLDINSHLPLAWKYKPSFIPILIVKRTKK